MAKITDPNILSNSKELEVLPFSKKDIEKFAFDVLADLGDEVINKAIEEGKINIPGLQSLVRSESDIITDEDKQLLATGKYYLQVYMEGDDIPYTYYPFASGNQLVFIYFYVSNSQLIGYYFDFERIVDLENTAYGYIYNEVETELKIGQGGTKLYKHHIIVETDDSEEFEFSLITASSTNLQNGFTFNIAEDYIVCSIEETSDYWVGIPEYIRCPLGSTLVVFLQGVQYSSQGNVTTITDTVTEL